MVQAVREEEKDEIEKLERFDQSDLIKESIKAKDSKWRKVCKLMLPCLASGFKKKLPFIGSEKSKVTSALSVNIL